MWLMWNLGGTKPVKVLGLLAKGTEQECQMVSASAWTPPAGNAVATRGVWLYLVSSWEKEDVFGFYHATVLTWNLDTEWRPYIHL